MLKAISPPSLFSAYDRLMGRARSSTKAVNVDTFAVIVSSRRRRKPEVVRAEYEFERRQALAHAPVLDRLRQAAADRNYIPSELLDEARAAYARACQSSQRGDNLSPHERALIREFPALTLRYASSDFADFVTTQAASLANVLGIAPTTNITDVMASHRFQTDIEPPSDLFLNTAHLSDIANRSLANAVAEDIYQRGIAKDPDRALSAFKITDWPPEHLRDRILLSSKDWVNALAFGLSPGLGSSHGDFKEALIDELMQASCCSYLQALERQRLGVASPADAAAIRALPSRCSHFIISRRKESAVQLAARLKTTVPDVTDELATSLEAKLPDLAVGISDIAEHDFNVRTMIWTARSCYEDILAQHFYEQAVSSDPDGMLYQLIGTDEWNSKWPERYQGQRLHLDKGDWVDALSSDLFTGAFTGPSALSLHLEKRLDAALGVTAVPTNFQNH